jgi:uncharacterized protein (DUF1501 family)
MQFSRRDFLRSTLVVCGGSVPVFLARSANLLANQAAPPNKGRILVVVQLDGGNDGLNTVVPFQDDEYRRLRPQLAIAAGEVHRLSDQIGLHPELSAFKKIYEDGQLAIVQGVGYPNPNRSHFESMAIWQTARLNPDRGTPGWLARCLDQRFNARGGDAPALHVSEELLPQTLYGGQRNVPSFTDLEQFRRRLGVADQALAGEQRAALDRIGMSGRPAAGSLLEFVQSTSAITYSSSARLEGIARTNDSGARYSEFYGLARRLKLIAQLIKAGLQTSIYYTQLGGFDTHANQRNSHANLLSEVGSSLKSFLDDVGRSGEASRVLVLVFSEFGRRLRENASAGTDHGTAAPVFLLGPGVKPGLHGEHPNLHDLVDCDPRHTVDFRLVYATLLDKWLEGQSEVVLGGRFEPLGVLAG